MSEITIGLKTVMAIVSGTAGIVSAYWLARRAAKQDNTELSERLHKLKLQVATAQDRDDVKELVRESLDS